MSAEVQNSSLIHSGRVFKLVRERLKLANGNTVDLDVIRHPGAAAMVPLKDKDTLYLIKQFRHTR